MVNEKETYHQLHRTISFSPWRPGFCGVFLTGLHGWARFPSIFFCVYRSNSLVGGQGVGAEQTVALRCMRELFGAGVGRSMRFGYWSERVI